MKVVESHLAETLLSLYVPQAIRDLKPVIAGGFIVTLYQQIIKKSSPEFDAKLTKLLSEQASSAFLPKPTPFSTQLKQLIGANTKNDEALQFGDIDVWFKKDNQIWNESHPLHFLISYLEPDSPRQNPFQTYPVRFTSSDSDGPKYYQQTLLKIKPYLEAIGLSTNHGIRSSSSWANTFFVYNPTVSLSRPIQMVRKPQEDVDQLLSSFDILNCCAAYHDGKFYFADGFEEAFQSNHLEKGSSFNKKLIQDKIWGANRAFKYAKRYGLEFSKEICEEMVRLFVDAEEFIDNLSKGKEEDQTVKTTEIDFEDAYGRIMTKISKETILSIARTTFSYFPDLILMKHFNKDYIFLFLNSKDPGIMFEVQRYLELQEKLARGEGESKEVSWNEIYYGLF